MYSLAVTPNGHLEGRGAMPPPIIMRTAATPMPTPKCSPHLDSLHAFGDSRRGSNASLDPTGYDQKSLVGSGGHRLPLSDTKHGGLGFQLVGCCGVEGTQRIEEMALTGVDPTGLVLPAPAELSSGSCETFGTENEVCVFQFAGFYLEFLLYQGDEAFSLELWLCSGRKIEGTRAELLGCTGIWQPCLQQGGQLCANREQRHQAEWISAAVYPSHSCAP